LAEYSKLQNLKGFIGLQKINLQYCWMDALATRR
jgi:hypothetical protein